ncbi:hypothetical protein LINPERPRIM_LOCUS31470 [Linum perenne]
MKEMREKEEKMRERVRGSAAKEEREERNEFWSKFSFYMA